MMESKITICKKVREDKALRDSFNALAEETFGLNFEDWYQNGYWKDNYIPYCALCDGQVVANVSVNPMEFVFDGEKRKVIQLGTVMTKPEYRMQGLSRRLMEEIEKDFGDIDGAFLFGNDSVTEFYPKFGFVASEETQYVGTFADVKKEQDCGASERSREKAACEAFETSAQDAAAVLVPMACKTDWDRLAQAVEKSACQGRLHMWHNAQLLLFYVSKFMQECVYWVESQQAYVIAEPEENTLMIHEVISEKQADLNEIINAFGGGFDRVVLGFTPECAPEGAAKGKSGISLKSFVWRQMPRREEDCTLFVKGRAFENFAEKKVMFPTLSHT